MDEFELKEANLPNSCSTTFIESDSENDLEYIYAALDGFNIVKERGDPKKNANVNIHFVVGVIFVSFVMSFVIYGIERIILRNEPEVREMATPAQITQTSASAEFVIGHFEQSVDKNVDWWHELVALLWKVLILIFKW